MVLRITKSSKRRVSSSDEKKNTYLKGIHKFLHQQQSTIFININVHAGDRLLYLHLGIIDIKKNILTKQLI